MSQIANGCTRIYDLYIVFKNQTLKASSETRCKQQKDNVLADLRPKYNIVYTNHLTQEIMFSSIGIKGGSSQ